MVDYCPQAHYSLFSSSLREKAIKEQFSFICQCNHCLKSFNKEGHNEIIIEAVIADTKFRRLRNDHKTKFESGILQLEKLKEL